MADKPFYGVLRRYHIVGTIRHKTDVIVPICQGTLLSSPADAEDYGAKNPAQFVGVYDKDIPFALKRKTLFLFPYHTHPFSKPQAVFQTQFLQAFAQPLIRCFRMLMRIFLPSGPTRAQDPPRASGKSRSIFTSRYF